MIQIISAFVNDFGRVFTLGILRGDIMPFSDYTSGVAAKTIIQALQTRCDAKTLLRLKKQKLLRPVTPYNLLMPQSICLEGLEAYSDATGLPLCYFLFGTMTPPLHSFSAQDTQVLWQLDHMSEEQLLRFRDAIYMCLPNEAFHTAQQPTAHRRMLYLLSVKKQGRIAADQCNLCESDNAQDLLVADELDRYINVSRYGQKHRFHSDAWPALSAYVGVSLHWIFQFKTPLYCRTQLADELFDYYTLLQPEQQTLFYSWLTNTEVCYE